MKKLFSVLILAAIFAGCSSDDDNNTTANLEGNWKMTGFQTENSHDLNNDGTASTDVMAQSNCYLNETLTFNADNSMTANSTSYLNIEMELITGSTDEYEYEVTCEEEIDVTTGTYVRNGNEVTIITDSGAMVGTLSGSELTFTMTNAMDFAVTDSQGTVYVTETEDVTMTYTKQ